MIINKVEYEADPKMIKLDIKVKTGPAGNTVVDLDGYLLEDIEGAIFVSSFRSDKIEYANASVCDVTGWAANLT